MNANLQNLFTGFVGLHYTDRLLSAGHDISDGGLVTCVMEMAFAGNCGIEVDITTKDLGKTCLNFYFDHHKVVD